MLWAAPNFTIGPVIARVHDMETKQNWAGFWVDQPCFSNFSEEGEQARESGVLVPYQIEGP
jgi:hypothetical protein